MHILTGLLIFVFGAIFAACDGDWSGIVLIAQITGFILLMAVFFYVMLHPGWLVIIGIVGLIIYLVCSND